jgi:8-oxo-dGTP diphosphatase
MFSKNRELLLLIRKSRPQWQKGFLNGIGGSIEGDETPLEAMKREGIEETGLSPEWIHKGVMQGINNDGSNFECHIFYAYSDIVYHYEQKEDEKLGLYNPKAIDPREVITNLNFLIPYGMYQDGSRFITLDYK